MAYILLHEDKKGGGPDSVFATFVGTDGIMSKSTITDATKPYNDISGPGTVLNSSSFPSIVQHPCERTSNVDAIDDEVLLLKIQCIVVTKSTQAGINSLWLKYGKNKGLPASLCLDDGRS